MLEGLRFAPEFRFLGDRLIVELNGQSWYSRTYTRSRTEYKTIWVSILKPMNCSVKYPSMFIYIPRLSISNLKGLVFRKHVENFK